MEGILRDIAREDSLSGGAGLRFRFGRAGSPAGPCVYAECEGRGLHRFRFHGDKGGEMEAELARQWPEAERHADHERAAWLVAAAFDRSAGEPLPIWLGGTPFRMTVWRALLGVPCGTLLSYRELALRAGRPGAHRAVGNAVGANPVAMFIPCHRIVHSSGSTRGYRWGEEIKRHLIRRENPSLGDPADPGSVRAHLER